MRLSTSFFHLLFFSTVYVNGYRSPALPEARDPVNTSANMEGNIETLCQSLNLSAADTQTITNKFGTASTNKNHLDVACTVAEFAVGKEQVISPTNKTVVGENWSLACVAEPHCIIQPRDAQEVSKTIKIIKHLNIRFAIRSGGHSPNPGWSSIGDAGILVDLQRLNQISLSDDKKVASLGPGGRWGEVIDTLDAQGATIVGGRSPIVGVGGLILGGLFHVSGEFGLAADNVKNFEIVLSDGTITDANSEKNSDLFWALKGGGPNFGIVTRFDLHTVPVRAVWYYVLAYSPDQASEVIDTMVKFQKEGGSTDVKSTVGLVMGLDTIVALLVYGAPQEFPSAFQPFYDLQPSQVVVPPTVGTFTSLTEVFRALATVDPLRHDYRGTSVRIDAQLDKEVYEFWRERAVAVRDATGANQTFAIQPIPANIAAQGIAKGGNPMGIPQEDHQWWTTLVDWKNAKDDDLVRSVSIETTEQWKKLGQPRNLFLDYIYSNDASRDQNPLASYGAENIKKLKEIALKYDAIQLFQRQQNSGFLLSKT
ncbi:FAD-binding domain-containing protein [Hypomontagnella monticulosa]|nr:FAD-binding domain-containing protein [Hypomontagnella monticulosa]